MSDEPSDLPVDKPADAAPDAPIDPVAVDPVVADPVVVTEAPPETLNPPTVQARLPVVTFSAHGQPESSVVPEGKSGFYVDVDGVRHAVQVVAERKDGSVDIILPASVGGYRRDSVRRAAEGQVADYME